MIKVLSRRLISLHIDDVIARSSRIFDITKADEMVRIDLGVVIE
jgi:hypothetical protein